MFNNSVRTKKGFSLIELMIVVGIIGILAALAVPQFSKFQARARQTEARTNLATIYTLNQAYFNDSNAFGSITTYGKTVASTGCTCATNSIGFATVPCTASTTSNTTCPRYAYSVAGASSTFLSTATSGTNAQNLIVPGCATADTFTGDHNRSISTTSNAVALCP